MHAAVDLKSYYNILSEVDRDVLLVVMLLLTDDVAVCCCMLLESDSSCCSADSRCHEYGFLLRGCLYVSIFVSMKS
jgi:hypothetical protein